MTSLETHLRKSPIYIHEIKNKLVIEYEFLTPLTLPLWCVGNKLTIITLLSASQDNRLLSYHIWPSVIGNVHKEFQVSLVMSGIFRNYVWRIKNASLEIVSSCWRAEHSYYSDLPTFNKMEFLDQQFSLTPFNTFLILHIMSRCPSECLGTK